MVNLTEPQLNFAQIKAEQLKGIDLELSWETRDEIIANLSKHSKVLSGLTIDSNAQENMRKANGDLVTKLMCLPLKVDGRLSGSFSRLGGGLNEVVFDLDQEARSRIIDVLMSNHQIALEAGSVSNELKSKQIDRNYGMINELLKLKTRILPINKSSYGLNTSALYFENFSARQPTQPLETAEVCRVLGFTYDSVTNEMRLPTNDQLIPDPNNLYRIAEAIPSTIQYPSFSWNQEVSHELRSLMTQKILAAYLPRLTTLQPVPIGMIKLTQRAEIDFYENAKSKDEYFRLIADRITKFQMSLAENEEVKKRWEQLKQQATNGQATNEQKTNNGQTASKGSSTSASLKRPKKISNGRPKKSK